jgi:predicted glycosyltransferase
MKILIDIKHPAQLNLFKGLSRELKVESWDVTICYLNRGRLSKIIQAEFTDFKTLPIGFSNGTKWSILWNGNIKRTVSFYNLIRYGSYSICVAASSIPLAFACKLAGVPIIQFYDDPERKNVNQINAQLSSQIFFPPIATKSKNVSFFNCLKEWSYLSPKRFQPDINILKQYGLSPHNYIFIREVSNKSFNYFGQEDALICSFSKQINSNAPVVLSLEDKSIATQFPKHWIVLQEPVKDIHSLIYYSKMLVSSGDSMAREGAMLGIPSIYCGFRRMKANELLADMGLLKHLPGQTAVSYINKIFDAPFNEFHQSDVRNQLLEEWDDMINFMKDQINIYKL